MKKALLIMVVLSMVPLKSYARDYMVHYIAEQYKEQPARAAEQKKIYHALQVDSKFGTKLLLLDGDEDRRMWLREYLSDHLDFIITIPDKDDLHFKTTWVYGIDVALIHPVLGEQWKKSESSMMPGKPYSGEKHFLIVDHNRERTRLLEMAVKDLGFKVSLSRNGTAALKLFQIQPDKYRLVITQDSLPGLSGTDVVKEMLKTDPFLPVILGTGYDRPGHDKVAAGFSGKENVVVKPVVLSQLSRTITALLKKKA